VGGLQPAAQVTVTIAGTAGALGASSAITNTVTTSSDEGPPVSATVVNGTP
jgi:hypothetical protein